MTSAIRWKNQQIKDFVELRKLGLKTKDAKELSKYIAEEYKRRLDI